MNPAKLLAVIAIVFFAAGHASPALGQKTATPSADSGDLVSINFQDADINQVIKFLGDVTGTVIIPNDELKGKITISSLEKISPEAVISVLESAVMMRGFTVVRSADVLKVVALPETKQTNVAVRVGTSPDAISDEDVVITQVMPLKYSSALKIKNDLQTLIGKHGNILANERTNTLIITDTASNIKRLATIISQMERPLPPTFQVKTFVLNYGDAKKIAEILTNLSKKEERDMQFMRSDEELAGDFPLELYGEIQAFVDEGTNAIVVATAPANFPTLEKLIKKLDAFPPQAMIEVIILDVTLDDTLSMGVEIGAPTSPTSTTNGILAHQGTSDGTDKYGVLHSLLGLATEAGTKGFTYRILNRKETFNLLGYILSTQENSKVLSTPKVLTSNNEESHITVGQEIPVIQSSVTDVVNNITTVNFKYENVGLQLKVTPRISQDDFVNMKVHAELKDLSPKTLFDASIINTREADATVIVPDNYTVILGGLMRNNDAIVEDKVPFLGDIPLLGNLFKKTKTTSLKTELLIFLTPHIIKSKEDLQKITEPSKNKMDLITEALDAGQLKKAIKEVVTQPAQDAAPKKKKEKKNAGQKTKKLTNAGS